MSKELDYNIKVSKKFIPKKSNDNYLEKLCDDFRIIYSGTSELDKIKKEC